MSIMRIIVADNMEEEALDELRAVGEVIFKPENLENAIVDADVLVVRSATKVTKELIARAKKLKIVARAGIGLDNVDQAACKERGIKVVNTPGASSNAVAEFALGLIIASLRNVQKAHYQMKNKKWEKKQLTGREIEGKTLGIIGYGRIGALLAKKAKALGMDVVACDPQAKEDSQVIFLKLDELFQKADVISIHAPLVDATKNLINKENIAKMKDGVCIVNTARGQIIDENALYEACKSGKILGAAIDVYWEEPYHGKLLELDNVYFTPHLGGSTKEAQIKIGKEIALILQSQLQ
ncbi:hydroxyacid dehydrogenase [Candidatus Micrarchaeota archaeon]|nr:hydroxyacid dehydrogenase [Candidatus Micrarchaeota archaeon]